MAQSLLAGGLPLLQQVFAAGRQGRFVLSGGRALRAMKKAPLTAVSRFEGPGDLCGYYGAGDGLFSGRQAPL
jgi:hypothetical protein